MTDRAPAALERLISLLAEKFNLDAVGKDRSKADPVAEFLAREISATDPDSDRGRYDVLVTLLNARGHRGTA